MRQIFRASILVLVLAITPVQSIAQEGDIPSDCPANRECVVYDGVTLEINPEDGFYQAIVVKEKTVIIKDFSGESTKEVLVIAGFESNGDTYELTREHTVEKDGIYADLELQDSMAVREID